MDLKTVHRFLEEFSSQKYKDIDVNYLEEINQINKDLINKTLPSEDSFLLSPMVKSCIQSLIIPVSYVKDLEEILRTKLSELTYRHLLMLNNLRFLIKQILYKSFVEN